MDPAKHCDTIRPSPTFWDRPMHGAETLRWESHDEMDKKTQEKLRKRLEARKAEIERDVSYMAGEIRALGIDQDQENGALGNHIADDGSSVAESERILTVTDDLQGILNQVNDALGRMDDGTYGICQRCGREIAEERLEAFPYVAYCISCQAVLEREQAMGVGANR
jgi:RNA polymerase-binding protein DksA